MAPWRSKTQRCLEDEELNQARSKPDTVDQPVRTAHIFEHHYNSTHYFNTETSFYLYSPSSRPTSHLRCGRFIISLYQGGDQAHLNMIRYDNRICHARYALAVVTVHHAEEHCTTMLFLWRTVVAVVQYALAISTVCETAVKKYGPSWRSVKMASAFRASDYRMAGIATQVYSA